MDQSELKRKLEILLNEYHLSKSRLAAILFISLPTLQLILDGGTVLDGKAKSIELALKDFVNVFNS
jgi:hypothetical protein